MTDFCPLSIQPDELALSYRARLARFNGWTNATIAARHLEDWVAQQRHSEDRLSAVEVLAAVAGMDVTTFVRNHTMLPFQRAVVSKNETVPHGSAERRTLLEKRAYCATRKNLYFCRTCAKEDIQLSGSAYWRRSHQLPGMFCCLRHKTALKSIPWTLEHMELPNDHIESGEVVPARIFDVVTSNPNVFRYYEICKHFMNGLRPIHAVHISKVVKDRYREILNESGETAGNSDIPSRLDNIFDLDWLDEVLVRRGRSSQQSIEYIQNFWRRMDLNLTTQGFALLLTTLYETADEAIDAIHELPFKMRAKRALSTENSDPWAFDEKAMREAYFAGHGNHVTISKTLGVTRHEVKRRLTVLGFPSLGRNDTAKLQSVVDSLIYGNKSLEQVCSEHGLQIQDARCRLMEAMGPLYEVISKLQMSAEFPAKSSLTEPDPSERREGLVFS